MLPLLCYLRDTQVFRDCWYKGKTMQNAVEHLSAIYYQMEQLRKMPIKCKLLLFNRTTPLIFHP